jgi:3-deoxy-D-manno-octulosonate 8-phosphate phosphatase (KDO 8-P phosphatase)
MEVGKMKNLIPKNFILDVDGVFTDGTFYYTADGKAMKKYGPHDNDGIKMIRGIMNIQAISADHRGFPITQKRIKEDMNIPLELVPEKDRLVWLKQKFNMDESIYMGDGWHDMEIFKNAGYSIAPANAFYLVKEKADYVTRTTGGQGAVLEACLHVLEKFFNQKIG